MAAERTRALYEEHVANAAWVSQLKKQFDIAITELKAVVTSQVCTVRK